MVLTEIFYAQIRNAQDWSLAQRDGLCTIPEKIQTDDREGNFQGAHEKLVEFLRVLDFDLWNFHQQGQGFHSVREV